MAYAFSAGPMDMTASFDVQNVTLGREIVRYSYGEESDSLADRDAGRIRLTRNPSSLLPGFPLPMLGLTAKY